MNAWFMEEYGALLRPTGEDRHFICTSPYKGGFKGHRLVGLPLPFRVLKMVVSTSKYFETSMQESNIV